MLEEDKTPPRVLAVVAPTDCVEIKVDEGNISKPILVNRGVKEGSGQSPVLFNVCINKIIEGQEVITINGIQLSSNN
jgi:hypothetical protein